VKKADLYVEGARLPDQLSRLLFLEGVVAGRRVLEVGTRSATVARFMLELGAAKVVCVVDDRDLLERLREGNELERVDYRSVRPASGSRPPGLPAVPLLPGDDGAFDLVIDFSLPEVLAAGAGERLADIKRLLSADGFAVTALSSTSPGLSALLPSGPAASGLGYRSLVEALQERFELVQVYFQSLLMGFLFGSFDHAAHGDGIAPHTQLMRDEPEPACAYVFAFGNAVPVIEDVCLVQVPFDALVEAIDTGRRRLADDDVRDVLVVDAQDGFSDRTEHTVYEPHPSLAAEVALRDAHIAALEVALTEARRHDPHLTVIPDSSSGSASDDEAPLLRLARDLDAATRRAVALEERAQQQELEFLRALAARDELRSDRDLLAEQLVSVDAAQVSLRRQLRELEEELRLTRMRVSELEDVCIDVDAQRAALTSELLETRTTLAGERLRANAERELLTAAVAENEAFVRELQEALASVGISLAGDDVEAPTPSGTVKWPAFGDDDSRPEPETSTVTVAGRLLTSLAERFAAADERAMAAEQQVAALREVLAAAKVEGDAREQALADVSAQMERTFEDRLSLAERRIRQDADARVDVVASDLEAALQQLEARTNDAARLAHAVQELISERDVGAAHRDELRLTTTQRDLLARDLQRAEERRRADQRILEDVRHKLEAATREVADLVGQRSVLQDVLQARERECRALVDDVDAIRASVIQQTARADVLARAQVDAQAVAEALGLETRRLHSALQESSQRQAATATERDLLARALADAEQQRAMHVDELRRLEAALSAADARTEKAEAALAQTVDETRQAAIAAQGHAEALAADHARTRDELAELTLVLLELESEVSKERLLVVEKLTKAQRDGDLATTNLAECEATIRALKGERDALLASSADVEQRAEADRSRVVQLTVEVQQLRDALERTQQHAALTEAELRLDRDTATAGLAQARTALDVASASLASLRATIETMTQTQQDALAHARSQAHAERSAAEASRDEAQAELAQRIVELDGAKADVRTLRDEVSALTKAHHDGGVELARARVELAEAARLRDTQRTTHEASRRELEQAHNDLRDTQALHARLREELVALTASRDEARTEVADVRGLLEAVTLERQAAKVGLNEARSLLDVERGRGELLSDELKDALDALANERARSTELALRLEDQLATGRADAHGRERAELLVDVLDEARRVGELHHARGDALAAIVLELQTRVSRERARGDACAGLLDEAQQALGLERARGDGLRALLREAQDAGHHAHLQNEVLKGVVDEARAALASTMAGGAKRHALEEPPFSDERSHARQKLERTVAATLREELADARARAESLSSELLGLRDALATSREDAAEAIDAAQRELHELAERHAAVVAAHHSELAEHERRLATQAARSTELEQALEAQRRAHVVDASGLARPDDEDEDEDVESAEAARQRLHHVEALLERRDETIAELRDRIDRLTERLIRTEGLR
jgi:chromosome segregation ATPase